MTYKLHRTCSFVENIEIFILVRNIISLFIFILVLHSPACLGNSSDWCGLESSSQSVRHRRCSEHEHRAGVDMWTVYRRGDRLA